MRRANYRGRFWGMAVAVTLAAAWLTAKSASPDDLEAWLLPIQTPRLVRDLAPGRFLVARRDLPDPNFAEAVVVLAHYDKDGAMGLIVNRATTIPLSRVFQDLKAAQTRKDPVYAGGPVAPMGVLALLRARSKPEDAANVLDDVFLVNSAKLIEQAFAAGEEPSRLRVFMGYAGWAAGQLEAEVELGMWHIFQGDAGIVFDPKPDSLWLRLIRRTELRIALHGTAVG